MEEQIKNLPLKVLQDSRIMLDKLTELATINADIVKLTRTGLTDIKFTTEDDRFFFTISSPRLNPSEANTTIFNISRVPRNAVDFQAKDTSAMLDVVYANFNGWVDLVRQYKTATLDITDPFLRKYQSEFEEMFVLVDDDADINPYEHQKQLAYHKLLETFQAEFEKYPQDDQLKELIEETKSLQDNIHTLSKRNVAKGFLSIMAKMKKRGIKFFSTVTDVAYKEIIKYGLHTGYDKLTQFLHDVNYPSLDNLIS